MDDSMPIIGPESAPGYGHHPGYILGVLHGLVREIMKPGLLLDMAAAHRW